VNALAKNIAIVSPSTLLATLRTVAHIWNIEKRHVNTMAIATAGARLHDNFALLVEELQNLGSQLDKAQKAHAGAMRRLTEGGKGSVLLQVQSLAEMGAPVKKSLPADLLGEAGAGIGDASAAADPSTAE
jgi:DNA recombination protein RmuC